MRPRLLAVLLLGICFQSFAQTVSISFASTPRSIYASQSVGKALTTSGYSVKQQPADHEIKLTVVKGEAESYSFQSDGRNITITGGDERGMIYGSLALAEDIRNGIKLNDIKSRTERPHFPLRAIKFDLPWDTYRHSYALDQHIETCRDIEFWRSFLDMMAENRFNSLSLWNLHPYPFMIRAKNFPEATPFNDQELMEWQRLFHMIFKMADERAIDTYLIPFNIFVSPEFSKAHNVAMDNLEHKHFVNGDTSEIVRRYTRESVTQVLQEYPELTGFGLTLGEGMGGMTPEQREDWMRTTIIEGMRLAGRKTKLIHRIPFSSTTGSLGITSIETEKLTRKRIEEEGSMDFIEGPVWADLKYNWSHAHSTPTLVKVHGGKLYDTYFNPEPSTYKITWTARNEDFFCLRWGVPGFVRDHIAANSQSYAGGYFLGSETYIPAKDYFTKKEGSFDWKYAFERQWLFYKIWGRLLYNPTTPDAVFRAEFVRRYGEGAGNLLEAYALASSTPLRLTSSFDFTWDFTLYSEGFLALDNNVKRVEYISVDRLISQKSLDPNYVSVTDYVDVLAAKGTFDGTLASQGAFDETKITPPVLADMLKRDCEKALELVKGIDVTANGSLMYEVADVKAWANLGLYFSEKLLGAVNLQTYRKRGGEGFKDAAVRHLERALAYWLKVVTITLPLYKEMPLVHFSEQDGKNWKENDHLRFHWDNLVISVEQDVQIARGSKPRAGK